MDHPGLEALLQRPLLESIWRRRTHRVSQGSSLLAGSMSYQSTNPRAPLGELEEAILIASTGCTGLTMPDRPFQDSNTKRPIMAKPDLWTLAGRTAGSPDNAQGTHFFLINDDGTYFLRSLPPLPEGEDGFTSERLIERAREAKVQILDHRRHAKQRQSRKSRCESDHEQDRKEMLGKGRDVSRDGRIDQRKLIFVGEQRNSAGFEVPACNLCLTGLPEYCGRKQTSRKRDAPVGDATERGDHQLNYPH